MRAILVDPFERKIEEVDVLYPNKNFDDFYAKIGCELVEFVDIDEEITMVIDEMGRLKDFSGAFKFLGSDDLIICSKAIIIGFRKGKFIPLGEYLESFKMIVEWVEKEDVPEPAFKIFDFSDLFK